jgi:hypothetical protein
MLTLRRRCKSGSKTIPALWVIGLLSFGLFGQQAQAAPVTGNITFTGGVELDTASAGTATMVTAWHGFATGDKPQVQTDDGSFAAFVAPGAGVTFSQPWTFNSVATVPSFWAVGGFTFDLTSSSITNQNPTPGSGAVTVDGIGSISGNGFDPTAGTFHFTTQDPSAESVFSFSAATGAIPESSTVALLTIGALGLTGMHFLGRKRRATLRE